MFERRERGRGNEAGNTVAGRGLAGRGGEGNTILLGTSTKLSGTVYLHACPARQGMRGWTYLTLWILVVFFRCNFSVCWWLPSAIDTGAGEGMLQIMFSSVGQKLSRGSGGYFVVWKGAWREEACQGVLFVSLTTTAGERGSVGECARGRPLALLPLVRKPSSRVFSRVCIEIYKGIYLLIFLCTR